MVSIYDFLAIGAFAIACKFFLGILIWNRV